jgi:hypothetical protein
MSDWKEKYISVLETEIAKLEVKMNNSTSLEEAKVYGEIIKSSRDRLTMMLKSQQQTGDTGSIKGTWYCHNRCGYR